ncbi:hypothetical protein TNCV_2131441 [Trichonephila clavipes]|nr:hypothetical protein TNCV_2131441 [Trichonephila clavipes]
MVTREKSISFFVERCKDCVPRSASDLDIPDTRTQQQPITVPSSVREMHVGLFNKIDTGHCVEYSIYRVLFPGSNEYVHAVSLGVIEEPWYSDGADESRLWEDDWFLPTKAGLQKHKAPIYDTLATSPLP